MNRFWLYMLCWMAMSFSAFGLLDLQPLIAKAETNDPEAQHTLAKQYHVYMNSPQLAGTPEEKLAAAIIWYERSAQQGYAPAQCQLGKLYSEGIGVPRDTDRAAELLRDASNAGEIYASHYLGILYLKGEGVPKNEKTAFELFQKAAGAGCTQAIAEIAKLYYSGGQTIEQDQSLALTWYLKAAEQGDKTSMHQLGLMYQNGIGSMKNRREAKKWFEKAALLGYDDPIEENIRKKMRWRKKLKSLFDPPRPGDYGYKPRPGDRGYEQYMKTERLREEREAEQQRREGRRMEQYFENKHREREHRQVIDQLRRSNQR